MLGLPDPWCNYSNKHYYLIFACFLAFHTNQLRAPLFFRQPSNSLFLHSQIKLHQLGFKLVSLFRPTLRIGRYVRTRCSSSLGSVPTDLAANRRWIYSKLLRYPLLFLFRFNKRLNLIPLYQTKLSVMFCHSNQKVALLGQKAKSPQKLFCLLFKNCTNQLNL
jgi:hypothetical protein